MEHKIGISGQLKAIKLIVYVSKASGIYDCDRMPENFTSILNIARKNNFKNDITGCMVFKNECYLQVLEGPEESIDSLMRKLHDDDRHHDMTLMIDTTIIERRFPDWSMKFMPSYELDRDFMIFIDQHLPSDKSLLPERRRLLQNFYQYHPCEDSKGPRSEKAPQSKKQTSKEIWLSSWPHFSKLKKTWSNKSIHVS